MHPLNEVVRASMLFVSGNMRPGILKPVWLVAAFALAAAVMFTALVPGDTRAQEGAPVSGNLVVVPNYLDVGQRTLAVGFLIQPDDVEVRIEYSEHFTPAGEPCEEATAGATQNSVASLSISLIACSAGEATVRLVVAETGVVIEEVGVTITEPAETDHAQPSIDRDALVTMYNAMDGDNWTVTRNWLSDKHISQWYGVTTDGDGRVVFLDLSENHLSGSMPPEIGKLSSLQGLNLSHNQLSGSIPPEIGKLSSLQDLSLDNNQLSGKIPPALSSLSNLEWLWISGNRLSGNLPSELGSLATLRSLSLDKNQLSGEIPPELGNLSNLESLYLSNNQLSGNIPPVFGNLSSLKGLSFENNQLSGKIPPELGSLSNLEWLLISGNRLSGEIPPELGDLSFLNYLHLDNNQLTGEIPPELGNLSNLEWLTLSVNRFTGCVPPGLRYVESNDLDQIGLPHCDVLLSGLKLSSGLLVPQFDQYRTGYSASVGLSPVTVTVMPKNDHNATFQFLDNNDLVLADADNSVPGFQVEFGGRVPAVKIRVVSQDTQATHTYVVTDLGNRYDANGDRVIQRDEVISAITDYFGDRITREEVIEIVKLYFSG